MNKKIFLLFFIIFFLFIFFNENKSVENIHVSHSYKIVDENPRTREPEASGKKIVIKDFLNNVPEKIFFKENKKITKEVFKNHFLKTNERATLIEGKISYIKGLFLNDSFNGNELLVVEDRNGKRKVVTGIVILKLKKFDLSYFSSFEVYNVIENLSIISIKIPEGDSVFTFFNEISVDPNVEYSELELAEDRIKPL